MASERKGSLKGSRRGSTAAAYVNSAFEPDNHVTPSGTLAIGANGQPVHEGDNVSLYDLNANKIAPADSNNNNKSEPAKSVVSAKLNIHHDPNYDPEKVLYEVQTAFAVFRQMLIPFLIAGFGSVFAGIVFAKVQTWSVFEAQPQYEIMVSAFLGLVGNIETTLASRLSTHANLGTLDRRSSLKEILIGNFLLVECQASTVGLFAGLMALLMSTLKEATRATITIDSVLLLCSSAMVTSIIANSFLAVLISIVIIIARKFNINPGECLSSCNLVQRLKNMICRQHFHPGGRLDGRRVHNLHLGLCGQPAVLAGQPMALPLHHCRAAVRGRAPRLRRPSEQIHSFGHPHRLDGHPRRRHHRTAWWHCHAVRPRQVQDDGHLPASGQW